MVPRPVACRLESANQGDRRRKHADRDRLRRLTLGARHDDELLLREEADHRRTERMQT